MFNTVVMRALNDERRKFWLSPRVSSELSYEAPKLGVLDHVRHLGFKASRIQIFGWKVDRSYCTENSSGVSHEMVHHLKDSVTLSMITPYRYRWFG